MREIIFRGKRKDNGEWVTGNLAAYDLICPGYPEDTINATGLYYNEIPYVGFIEIDFKTVGQFTGLTDKNGKKIFEGDIMRNVGNVVEFCSDSFCINGDSPLGFWTKTEIIGNVHDNPELLKI